MAPRKKIETGVNTELLNAIASGTITRIDQNQFATLKHDPALVIVNTTDIVDGKALVELTNEGKAMVENTFNIPAHSEVPSNGYEIISGLTLPPRKRAGRSGGGVNKYPFDKLEIGQSFFVAATAALANPVKTLASTISAQNHKYSDPTGQFEAKERTQRGPGNKAVLGPDGKKVKEMVQVEVRKPNRKFSMRGVKAGQTIGTWVAPADGALIARVALD